MLNELLGIEIYSADLNLMLPKNGGMVTNSAPLGSRRAQLYETISHRDFEIRAKQLLGIKMPDVIFDRCKVILRCLGLWHLILASHNHKSMNKE